MLDEILWNNQPNLYHHVPNRFWIDPAPKTQNKTSWSRNLEHTYLKEEARDQAGVVSIWRSCPIHVYVGLPTYQDVRDPRSFRPLGLNLFIIFC